jgi:hypothetical protein
MPVEQRAREKESVDAPAAQAREERAGLLRQLWQLRAVHWALGGGLLASLCCIGPPVAVLLGLSGASFLVGLTLYSPYFYGGSLLLLLVGYIYIRRRQATVCSTTEQRRNIWLLPIVMAGVMTGSYLLLTEAVTPKLTSVANDRLSPGQEHLLDMPGMSGMTSAGGQIAGDTAGMGDKPVMLVAAAPAQAVAGNIHRAELVIDKMT